MSVLSSPQEVKERIKIEEWLNRLSPGGPVVENKDDSDDDTRHIAFKLLAGPLKRVTRYFHSDIRKTVKHLQLILDYAKETHPGLWEWVKGSRSGNFSSDMLNLNTNQLEAHKLGHSVYYMELKVDDGKGLGQLLLSQPNTTRRTMDFVLDNNLLDLPENTPIVLKYIGQTSAVAPVTRLQQHLNGNSGAVLVQSVVQAFQTNIEPPADILNAHSVLIPCAKLNDFSLRLGLTMKQATNISEILLINLLRATQQDKLFGLNVDCGSLFGEFFDAAEAGRQNRNFPPTVIQDLRNLFVTGECCQREQCLNVVRKHNNVIYSLCQSCSGPFGPNKTHVIASVVTDKNGRVGVVQSGDGMTRNEANNLRRLAVQRSLGVYDLNKAHRCVPFLEDSLPDPLNESVTEFGHMCDVEGCSSRRRIDKPHVAKKGKSNDSLTWGISSRCKRHHIKGESRMRRAYFDVQSEVWRWKP